MQLSPEEVLANPEDEQILEPADGGQMTRRRSWWRPQASVYREGESGVEEREREG